MDRLDPRIGRWQTIAPLQQFRKGCAGAALNGKFYVIGGFAHRNTFNIVERYDPRADRFEFVAPMTLGRQICGAAAVGGRIVVVGGCSANDPIFPNRARWVTADLDEEAIQ